MKVYFSAKWEIGNIVFLVDFPLPCLTTGDTFLKSRDWIISKTHVALNPSHPSHKPN